MSGAETMRLLAAQQSAKHSEELAAGRQDVNQPGPSVADLLEAILQRQEEQTALLADLQRQTFEMRPDADRFAAQIGPIVLKVEQVKQIISAHAETMALNSEKMEEVVEVQAEQNASMLVGLTALEKKFSSEMRAARAESERLEHLLRTHTLSSTEAYVEGTAKVRVFAAESAAAIGTVRKAAEEAVRETKAQVQAALEAALEESKDEIRQSTAEVLLTHEPMKKHFLLRAIAAIAVVVFLTAGLAAWVGGEASARSTRRQAEEAIAEKFGLTLKEREVLNLFVYELNSMTSEERQKRIEGIKLLMKISPDPEGWRKGPLDETK